MENLKRKAPYTVSWTLKDGTTHTKTYYKTYYLVKNRKIRDKSTYKHGVEGRKRIQFTDEQKIAIYNKYIENNRKLCKTARDFNISWYLIKRIIP